MASPPIFLHQVVAPGEPGNITDAEAAVIRADQAEILARPVVEGIRDLADVADTVPAGGQVYQYNGTTQAWEPVTPTFGLSEVVKAGDAGSSQSNVTRLVLQGPLTTSSAGAGSAYIAVLYGSTGVSAAIARDDHTHTLFAALSLPFDASGSLSSGTRTLISGTLSGLTPAITYRITAELKIEARGEGTGAGRSLPRTTLNGNARDRFGGSRGYVRHVSGVDREATMKHPGVTVTGVTSMAVNASIAHVDGDPKYIGGGELVVHVEANR